MPLRPTADTPSRRSLLASAAWSVPALTVVGAAPAFAASEPLDPRYCSTPIFGVTATQPASWSVSGYNVSASVTPHLTLLYPTSAEHPAGLTTHVTDIAIEMSVTNIWTPFGGRSPDKFVTTQLTTQSALNNLPAAWEFDSGGTMLRLKEFPTDLVLASSRAVVPLPALPTLSFTNFTMPRSDNVMDQLTGTSFTMMATITSHLRHAGASGCETTVPMRVAYLSNR